MQKTIKLFTVLIASSLVIAGCGGGAMSNSSPREVTLAFFERLSKKDIEGAKKLATKESESTMNMMKTAFEMAEKFKGLSDETKEDMTEEFKNIEISEGKITGDNAVVPVKNTKKNEEFEIPLKKEEGSWKVDFSPSTVSKMGKNKGGEDVDPEEMEKGMKMADSMMKNMDPEKMKQALAGIDSMVQNMTPEQKEKMKEMMEKFKEK
jgi:hypothetical protein